MKKVLITGGAGFLGSHLCDRFISEGYHVTVMDDLSSGDLNNIDIDFIHHNICEEFNYKDDIDYILHFASPASPIDYLKRPLDTIFAGSIGTKNILDLAVRKKARILIASTSEIYGDPLIHPQTEEYWGNVNTIGDRSVYDEAKRFQEALTMAYHKTKNLDIRIVRIFNTYGKRMKLDDGRALPTFISQATQNIDLTVFGDGTQTRSFCYVDDTVEGIYRLLHSDYIYPVNIGNPEEVSINDFAKEVIKLTNSKSKIIYKPLPMDDPLQRCPDITLAKKLLNWKPKVNRAEGLKKTIL